MDTAETRTGNRSEHILNTQDAVSDVQTSQYDLNALRFLYEHFGRHLLSGAEENQSQTGRCSMTGLSNVPVIVNKQGSARWVCLQSMLTTSEYLGTKNGGSKKRLGDKGRPRLLLVRAPRSILWIHKSDFDANHEGRSKPASPPRTDHNLFDVRCYGGSGQPNKRVVAQILMSDIDLPYVVFPGFSLDQTFDLRDIRINVDPDLFRLSGAEATDYRRRPLREALLAAQGLAVISPEKGRKVRDKETAPCLVVFLGLLRASEVEFDHMARRQLRQLCRDNPRYATLREILFPIVHGPELPFLRDVIYASRHQAHFTLEDNPCMTT